MLRDTSVSFVLCEGRHGTGMPLESDLRFIDSPYYANHMYENDKWSYGCDENSRIMLLKNIVKRSKG